MYILFHSPFSQHARRVVSLLIEAELPYELRHVAMEKSEHTSPEYLAINPNHQIPTLLDGDIKIHESNAILRYLCTKHALARLESVQVVSGGCRHRFERSLSGRARGQGRDSSRPEQAAGAGAARGGPSRGTRISCR
jgi:glutathione S-transferase